MDVDCLKIAYTQETPHSDTKIRISDSTLNTSNSLSQQAVSFQMIFKQIFKKKQTIKSYDIPVQTQQFSSKIRLKLIDWIISVCWNYQVNDEGLFFTICLLDISIKKIIVPKKQLQALALTCLYLSIKYTQRKKFKMKQILDLCKNIYTVQQIISLEQKLLMILEFDLEIPTLYKYWQIYKSKSDEDIFVKSNNQILFLLELSLLMQKNTKCDKDVFLQIISFMKNKSTKSIFIKELIQDYKKLEYKTIVNKYLSKFDVKLFMQCL